MKPAVLFIGFVWAIIAFALIRIVIPGLVNMHNDAAILVALLIVSGFGYGTYIIYRFIKENAE